MLLGSEEPSIESQTPAYDSDVYLEALKKLQSEPGGKYDLLLADRKNLSPEQIQALKKAAGIRWNLIPDPRFSSSAASANAYGGQAFPLATDSHAASGSARIIPNNSV